VSRRHRPGHAGRVTPLLAAVATALATVVPAVLLSDSQPTSPPGGPDVIPVAAKAPAYRATVTRTRHGIPHVVARNWGSLGFGHGYATAQTNLCNLADTLVTGRGERSRWFGPDARYEDHVTLSATNLQADALFTDIRNRKVVERLLADPRRGPGRQARAMVEGYVAGVNKYVRDVGGARGVKDPTCRGKGYIKPDATALDLWYGVYAANLLASTGVFVPQIVDAAPPTPDLLGGVLQDSGAATFQGPPSELPDRDDLLRRLGKDPDAPFGSNATAVGGRSTTTGRGMVLGNPHFPWRGRYRFEQAHLTIPGTYDVAGASLIGSPVVNIGWNKDVAWSHTVSTAFRFTPYEYKTAGSPTTYLTTEGPQRLERREVSIRVKRDDGSIATVEEDLYRTDEGYVLSDPDVLMPWLPTSFWALRDANAEHLRTVDTFLEMGKARTVRDLIRRQDTAGGMPWVNTTAADRFGDTVYADHSVVPHVTDAMVQRCATPVGRVLLQVAGLPGLDGTRAKTDCSWGTDPDAGRPGIFGDRNLPETYRRDWVANANDSYWMPNDKVRLEGYARIIGCEECERSLRTRVVYRYVQDRLTGADGRSGRKVSLTDLLGFQHQNRVLGAELSKEDEDLAEVCTAAGGGESCDVLDAWDATSDRSSVGPHIFEEFWKRVPKNTAWARPFDPADPLGTPRDLNEANPQVVKAMRDALAHLDERRITPDTPWGQLQVAADEGAPPIGLGGGDANAGNANALATGLPATNTDRLRPIAYGSSHIQGVAFLDGGRVAARTVLTYGQSTDPTSPWAHDQTRLFGQERWVAFPFTAREIDRQQISRRTVTGG
jgi:acyl-homoserine-lactone acylase